MPTNESVDICFLHLRASKSMITVFLDLTGNAYECV